MQGREYDRKKCAAQVHQAGDDSGGKAIKTLRHEIAHAAPKQDHVKTIVEPKEILREDRAFAAIAIGHRQVNNLTNQVQGAAKYEHGLSPSEVISQYAHKRHTNGANHVWCDDDSARLSFAVAETLFHHGGADG